MEVPLGLELGGERNSNKKQLDANRETIKAANSEILEGLSFWRANLEHKLNHH
jgi:hypothetical protein